MDTMLARAGAVSVSPLTIAIPIGTTGLKRTRQSLAHAYPEIGADAPPVFVEEPTGKNLRQSFLNAQRRTTTNG